MKIIKSISGIIAILCICCTVAGCGRAGGDAVKYASRGLRRGQVIRAVGVGAGKAIYQHSSRNPLRCNACEGTGRYWNVQYSCYFTCAVCNGTGHR